MGLPPPPPPFVDQDNGGDPIDYDQEFELVAFPHLGLSLKIGHCYSRRTLEERCKGDSAKLLQLRLMLDDEAFFTPV